MSFHNKKSINSAISLEIEGSITPGEKQLIGVFGEFIMNDLLKLAGIDLDDIEDEGQSRSLYFRFEKLT